MLVVAVTMGVLLALTAGTAAQHSGKPLDQISGMPRRLEESVKVDVVPNPSVPLAMNLAGDTSSNTREQLLQQIKEEAVEKAQKDVTSGQVAPSVLALLSSGQDPRHVHAQQRAVDLVRVLQQKTDEQVAELGSITVHYAVTNMVRGQHFNIKTTVTVPHGSTLLKVLQVAEEKDPENFSFEMKETLSGPMVVSIHGLAANSDDKTFWWFLLDGVPLQEGVGSYQPQNGEHIEAVFSTY